VPNEGRFPDKVNNRKDFGLIPLEKQVISLVVAGYSSAESAEILGISEPTVKLHLASLCDRLRVSNELELILFALHHQLIETHETSPSEN
jgi:DNA-binding CsgD family transcriptional regulator